MTLPDFLRSDEYGEIFLSGHRLTLYQLLKAYKEGQAAERLATTYPSLSQALVDKVIAFYHDNHPEVERYLEETRAEIEKQMAAPARGPSMPELKRRLEANRQSEIA